MALSVIAPGYVSGMGFSGWRRSEDFLTGEFFGLLRYLPVEVGVLPVLARAAFRGTTFRHWLAAAGGQVDLGQALREPWRLGRIRPGGL